MYEGRRLQPRRPHVLLLQLRRPIVPSLPLAGAARWEEHRAFGVVKLFLLLLQGSVAGVNLRGGGGASLLMVPPRWVLVLVLVLVLLVLLMHLLLRTSIMPSLACWEQNSAFLLPSTVKDGIVVQFGWRHLLLLTLIMPSVACWEQNRLFFVPAIPYVGRFSQFALPHWPGSFLLVTFNFWLMLRV